MGVPARHREPAHSGEAGGPPGNRAAGKDARKEGHIRGRSKQFMKHPG
jgi:hypothetical protein